MTDLIENPNQLGFIKSWTAEVRSLIIAAAV